MDWSVYTVLQLYHMFFTLLLMLSTRQIFDEEINRLGIDDGDTSIEGQLFLDDDNPDDTYSNDESYQYQTPEGYP